jgi:hypothetical protein
LRSPPPQGGASTNFANWAIKERSYKYTQTAASVQTNTAVCVVIT